MKQEFLKIIKVGFMHGVEEPWCNNQGVVILPYVLINNEYHYLLVKENNPLFKNRKISEYSTITCGLENLNPYFTVINVLKEKIGIVIPENHKNVEIYYLGNNYANKSSTKLWYFFATNLTNLSLDLTATYKGIGDGSIGEKEIYAKFVSHKNLNKSNDALSLATYGKFVLSRIKEKHIIENETIMEWVEEHDDEKYSLEEIKNEKWWNEVTNEEWNDWNDTFNNKIKEIDKSILISSSISPVIYKLKRKAENFENVLFKSAINKLADKYPPSVSNSNKNIWRPF